MTVRFDDSCCEGGDGGGDSGVSEAGGVSCIFSLLRLVICSEPLERNLVSLVAQLGSPNKPSFPLPARVVQDANRTPPSALSHCLPTLDGVTLGATATK